MANKRPRLMFICFLLGGVGLALEIGLLDVFVLQEDAIKAQGSASAGLDLALGVPLLALGALLATGHLHRQRRAPAQAEDEKPSKLTAWARRVLYEPRFALAVLIGAVVGTPGASYVTALQRSAISPPSYLSRPNAMAGHFTFQPGSSACRPGRSADQGISARAATSGGCRPMTTRWI